MSDAAVNCRTEAELHFFYSHGLPDAELDSIEKHVNGCEMCAERLDRLTRIRPLEPGTRLQDRYTIKAVLGLGGMGVVYEAFDGHFDPPRKVAVKMISAELAASAETEAGTVLRKRFLDEANILARMTGDHFVKLHDHGDWKQHLFIVMEFIEGTLASRKERIWPPLKAARLVERLAEAMSLPHGMNIVHRDLKPENILLPDEERPKITDFGVAVFCGEVGNPAVSNQSPSTPEAWLVGTPQYMAPEQWEGNPQKIRTPVDIWALGVILYELLTGKPPFIGKVGQDRESLRTMIMAEGSRPTGLVNVPADLQAICLRCLEKKPENRYATMRNLAEDLRHFQADEPVVARPVGPVGRLWRWAKRKPNRKIAFLAMVLISVGIVATPHYLWVGIGTLATSAGRTDGRDGPIVQDFTGGQNPVSYSWAQASVGSWIVFLQKDDADEDPVPPENRRFLRIWFKNGETTAGPSYPSNLAIRAKEEMFVLVKPNERYLKLDTRVPENANDDEFLRDRHKLNEIQVAIRVRDARGTYWEYAYHHDDYIEFTTRNDQGWKTHTIDLHSKSWVVFPPDGNAKHAATLPDFSKISDVVVEVGSRNKPGDPRRPGPGVGRIDIRNVRLDTNGE